MKGWVKILTHSQAPQALFSSTQWFLQTPDPKLRPGFKAFCGTVIVGVEEVKAHSDSVVAKLTGFDDRGVVDPLRGALIFLPRSSFPKTGKDEYYWIDLLGLDVVNRQGQALGRVRDLMSTGPHAVLCVEYQEEGKTLERMIPFVATYVDAVELPKKLITVDWQSDY